MTVYVETYGANGCCGRNKIAGCCGSCCDDSFNDDSLEKHLTKSGAAITCQPSHPKEMTAVSTSTGGDTKVA